MFLETISKGYITWAGLQDIINKTKEHTTKSRGNYQQTFETHTKFTIIERYHSVTGTNTFSESFTIVWRPLNIAASIEFGSR